MTWIKRQDKKNRGIKDFAKYGITQEMIYEAIGK